MRRFENRIGGCSEHGGGVGHPRLRKLFLIDPKQVLEVGPGRPDLSESVLFNVIEAEFGDSSSQSPGEADGVGDWREVGQAIRGPCPMDSPCGQSLERKPSRRRERPGGETLDPDFEGQLSERHPVKTHPTPGPEAVVSHEIVRGHLRRSHDQDFWVVSPSLELPRSETNSCLG